MVITDIHYIFYSVYINVKFLLFYLAKNRDCVPCFYANQLYGEWNVDNSGSKSDYLSD